METLWWGIRIPTKAVTIKEIGNMSLMHDSSKTITIITHANANTERDMKNHISSC